MRRATQSLAIPTLLLASVLPSVAVAEASSSDDRARTSGGSNSAEPLPLRYDLPLDLRVTLGSGALALTLGMLSSRVAPSHCSWCDRDENGHDTLNGFDSSVRESLRWSNTRRADRLSNIAGYGLAPLATVGTGTLLLWHAGRIADLPLDALLVAEAVFLAMDVNQVTKLAFARERPYVHARTAREREALRSSEDNLSFYSGQTSFVFSLAVATGTVALLRRYRLAPVVWASGLAVAFATSYLRIAGDRHYATDVICGAAFGSAIGFSVPYFGHRPAPTVQLAAMPVPGGSGLSLYGVW